MIDLLIGQKVYSIFLTTTTTKTYDIVFFYFPTTMTQEFFCYFFTFYIFERSYEKKVLILINYPSLFVFVFVGRFIFIDLSNF